MLDTIKLQKQELEILLSKNYLPRTGLEKARNYLKSDLIKVITGPRRAGKSVFGLLMLEGKKYSYLNFEDENLLKVKDYDKLISRLDLVYPGFEYVFFDEIQNLPKWEIFVNKLQRRGYNIVLTGSNSKLLSGELASSLTGRYHQIEVYPLSFSETKILNTNNKLTNYLITGGYPEVVINNLDPRSYLQTLFEAILFKDVTKRYKLRHPQKVYELATYLMTNFASIYSFHKIKKAVGLSSVSTVQKYAALLEQTYLVFSLNKFNYKIKNQFGYNKKLYSVDNGLVSASGIQNSQNLGRLLENTIFGHLIRQGFTPNKDLFYYKTKTSKEVDFVIKKGIKVKELIQVSFSLESDKTKKREISALLEASKELDCKKLRVITMEEEAEERGIEFIKAEDYLTFPH